MRPVGTLGAAGIARSATEDSPVQPLGRDTEDAAVDTDNILKQLADRYPDHIAAWLLARPIEALGPVEVLKTELFAEPIRADFATFIRSAAGILHVEFQFALPGAADTPLPLRMLDYYVRLYRRHRVPVEQVLVLVKATTMPTPAVFETGHTRHEYRVVRLWEEDPAPLLVDEALLPLAVLARTEDRRALVSTVAEQVRRIEPMSRRRQVVAMAELLAGLEIDWEVVKTMFEDTVLAESSVYKAILRQGRDEGREEGLSAGRAEVLEEARRLVLLALASRFGPVPAEVAAAVERCQPEALDELVAVAATCPTVTAFATAAEALAIRA